jgi:ribosomal protein S18 acetylase RimI-like enzyme
MIIRRATFEDYEDFFGLFCEVQDIHSGLYPKLFKKSSRKVMSKKVFRQYVDDSKNFILMAYDKNIPMGYIFVTIKPSVDSPFYLKPRVVYINQICVTHQFRKKGVAKKMVEQVVKLAKGKKINAIHLDVWDLNENAKRSFGKLGFKVFNVKMELTGLVK